MTLAFHLPSPQRSPQRRAKTAVQKYVFSLRRLPLTLTLAVALAIATGCATPDTAADSPRPDPENPSASTAIKPPVQPPVQPQVLELALFSSDELFAAGGGGCGMMLKPAASATEQEGSLLFHGLDDAPMLMKINGEMVSFTLEEGRGAEFYGQTPSQTFSNAALDITAIVDVEVGEPGEIESVEIPSGSVFLQGKTSNIQIPVEGDAGC